MAEIMKCYTCEGGPGGRVGCHHTSTFQGSSRPSSCWSWWQCNMSCTNPGDMGPFGKFGSDDTSGDGSPAAMRVTGPMDTDIDPDTGKEIQKCWECRFGRNHRNGCRHTGSMQGTRTAGCLTWWECNNNCENNSPFGPMGRLDNPTTNTCTPMFTSPITGKKTFIESLHVKQLGDGGSYWITNPTPAQIAGYYFKNNDGSPVKQLPEGYLTRCGETWEDVCPGYSTFTDFWQVKTNCDVGNDQRDTIYIGHQLIVSKPYYSPLHTHAATFMYPGHYLTTDTFKPPDAGEIGGELPRSFFAGWTYALPGAQTWTGNVNNPTGGLQPVDPEWGPPFANPVIVGNNWTYYIGDWANMTKERFLSDEFRRVTDPWGVKQYEAGGIGSTINNLTTLFPCSPIVFSSDYDNHTSYTTHPIWSFQNGWQFSKINLNSGWGTCGGSTSWGCPGYATTGFSVGGGGQYDTDAMDRICHMPWPAHHRGGVPFDEANGYGDYPPHSFLAPTQQDPCYTTANISPLWWVIRGVPGMQANSSGWKKQTVGFEYHSNTVVSLVGNHANFRPYPDFPIDPALPLDQNANAFRRWKDARLALFTVFGPQLWPTQRDNDYTVTSPQGYPALWIPTISEVANWGIHDVNFYLRVWVGRGEASAGWEGNTACIDFSVWDPCVGCCQQGYLGQINTKIAKTETKASTLAKLRSKKR